MTTTSVPETYGLGGVGETARWMAASRARESRRPDRLFDDPFAQSLAGPDGASLLTYFHPAHANDNGNPYLPIRTRWFDDYLAASVTPGCQVVGLAAGLDTRAFRLDWPDDVTVFEVDQPAVLAYKQQRLAGQGARERCRRRTVGVDLSQDWSGALREAGYDPSRPSVWFVEGLLFYLPEEVSASVLAEASRLSAPGSRLAADLIGTGIFKFPYMRQFLQRLADADSPWCSGTDAPAEFVAGCGWDQVHATEPGRPDANYGRWPEDASPVTIPNLPRIYLVSATRGADPSAPAGDPRG